MKYYEVTRITRERQVVEIEEPDSSEDAILQAQSLPQHWQLISPPEFSVIEFDMPDAFTKRGVVCALDLTAKAIEGIGFSIISEWAEALIQEHKLVLVCGDGDMTGESHAIFEHNGEKIRLKRDWTGGYRLFHGAWKPDPHYTGD